MTQKTDLNVCLGNTLRFIRKTAKVSQTELGEILGLHQTAVCRVEKGQQLLTPEQLFNTCDHFGVEIDDLMYATVDYGSIARKFGMQLPLPKRYMEHPFAKLRESMPLLRYVQQNVGAQELKELLKEMKVESHWTRSPEMRIGTEFQLDLMRKLIDRKLLNKEKLKTVSTYARLPSTQGFLHKVFSTQAEPMQLVHTRILNSHHYEQNFIYEVENCSSKSLELLVRPAAHMSDVDYKDDTLGDSLCSLRKENLKTLSLYIGRKEVAVTEKECHFHGAEKCVYSLAI